MGSRTDPEARTGGTRNHAILDESGQLAIDFYIGLSIFLITLIIASVMISGLLVSLQSKKIDFDAVAYRTGVILVEDPGHPNTIFNYPTITESDEWEFIGYDQKKDVRRFGLALYKSTPRTLSEQKIIAFNNTTRFPTLSEYRERIIFGDYPYHFNITLKVIGDSTVYSVGESYDPDSTYGYIRRVVLVKNQSNAEVNMSPYYNNTTPGNGQFFVKLNYTALLDSRRAPHYWIEPPKEDITINLTNVGSIRNSSNDILLNDIRIRYVAKLTGGDLQEDFLPVDVIAVIDNTNVTFKYGTTTITPVNSSIDITFPAGYFIPPSGYANITLIQMKVYYYFDPTTVDISQSNYSYDYLPSSQGFSQPYLNPAIMEVRIW